MSSYFQKKVKCGCCGAESVISVLTGLYRHGAMEMDTYPGEKAVYDWVQECPVCGYAGHDISAAANEEVKKMIADGAHIEEKTTDPTERRLLAAAKISETDKDLKKAAYGYLMLSWYRRDHGTDSREAMEKAAALYAAYLEDHADIDPAITYIDIERQLGNFKEAEETAESLENYISDDFRRKLITREKELSAAGDSGRHSVKEVSR